MIVAGEASGDKHGARLVSALRSLRPAVEFDFFGSGGDEMRAAGVDTLVDSRNVAIMGAVEVARALPRFLDAFRTLRDCARLRHPRIVILIDWPEFNLRLARRLNRDGHRIIYYISPQVWAWRRYRIRTIQKHVEEMLVILPFEKDFYEEHGVDVRYVGHPLLDSIQVQTDRSEVRQRLGISSSQKMIALMPGSRHSEIKYILPPLLEAADTLAAKRTDLRFVLVLAPSIANDVIEDSVPNSVRIERGETYNTLAAADLAVCASGTATLESAILRVPLIVVYKSSALNWRLFWPLIKVPFVGLPNLIAGKQIAPELLQEDLNAQRLQDEIVRLIDNPELAGIQREELNKVRAKLGEANASTRAAQFVIEALDKESVLK